MAQQWHQAQDTFVAMLDDGSQRFVTKGDVLPESHELVKRDQNGSGLLFRPLESGDDEAPAKSLPAKAAAPPKASPVRPAGKAS